MCAGQGVNQGLEDAHDLAAFLGQAGPVADSLRKFEASRIPRVQTIMAAEMVGFLREVCCSMFASVWLLHFCFCLPYCLLSHNTVPPSWSLGLGAEFWRNSVRTESQQQNAVTLQPDELSRWSASI